MIRSEDSDVSMPRERNGSSVRRVQIRNYKSIDQCSVELGSLTVLVGRNGSGKSNFLDGLHFVADGLETSLDHAIKARGGIDAVRRRSTGHPRNFAIRLEIALPDGQTATYGFEVGARSQGGFVIRREELELRSPLDGPVASFKVRHGDVAYCSVPNAPAALGDRLYLVNVSGLREFRGVFDALVAMGFYNLNPQAMKELQSPDSGELLHRDGSNIASVVARLETDQPLLKQRITQYLQRIVPDVSDVGRVTLGPRETIEFRQKIIGAANPWRFYAVSMSDGTLRALGTLVAATQLARHKHSVTLVGIEEPETALHPAAAGALMDALREASTQTQVLITSHSPDLLDQTDPEQDALLAVSSADGTTKIGEIDDASRGAIRDHLYTVGELLRMDQIEPDKKGLDRQRSKDLPLFDTLETE